MLPCIVRCLSIETEDMLQPVTIVKIGGNIIDNANALSAFLRDFSAIAGEKILVHGGGKKATEFSATLGIPTTMLHGRRVTDAATLDVVTMVYGGLINKTVVAQLQAHACNAIGLTGADANVITAHRRAATPVDYGFVGDVDHVQSSTLLALLAAGCTPVVAPLTHDGKGTLLNTNADTMASALAIALATERSVRLVYCFEKQGVLADVNDDSSAIAELSYSAYGALKERGAVAQGMLPKLDNAFAALRAGVQTVAIGHASNIAALLANGSGGTQLVQEPREV